MGRQRLPPLIHRRGHFFFLFFFLRGGEWCGRVKEKNSSDLLSLLRDSVWDFDSGFGSGRAGSS